MRLTLLIVNKNRILNQYSYLPFLALIYILVLFPKSYCSAPNKTVVILEIKDQIDPRMSRYMELGLEYAKTSEADAIIIDMDTYGGAVNDADQIVTALLEQQIPVYVYIDKDAASAGALISIACDSIYMTRGASIGAATVVTADGAAAPDKYQSYMRSKMRATAEAKGRDPKIAEAMVDQNLQVDSVSQAGQVITFSTSEAIKNGFCEGEVSSIEELLEKVGLKDAIQNRFSLSNSERIIAFFLNPMISGLLILIIIGGIYYELQTPGVGFPILASFVALLLYLTPYYLNGLAANWEIIMLMAGLILIAIEVFVIPGFGVAGISGIITVVGSLILIMLNNDFFDFSFVGSNELIWAILTTVLAIISSFILLFVGGVSFANSPFFKKVALQGELSRAHGYTSDFKAVNLVGHEGVSYTVLRPSGKIMIGDQLYDAYTRGEFLEKNVQVIVIAQSGTSLQVKESIK